MSMLSCCSRAECALALRWQGYLLFCAALAARHDSQEMKLGNDQAEAQAPP
jgi:hypothetical protein